MYTVGKIAKRFGLSRSTLLYYDRIGLLKPSGRTRAEYRQYTEKDSQRLAQICQYREAGVPLAEIERILRGPGTELARVLEERLVRINDEVRRLRDQQRVILGLLGKRALMKKVGVMNKEQWIELLRAAGFDEAAMDRWHFDFERTAPEQHQEFLEFLCIPDEEIREIREWSRQGEAPQP
jgi:DNA-binding transcriptional MerR regulator